MTRFALPLIAVVASALLCVQNLHAMTGFSWALIHGAGIFSAFALVPAAIALAVLWAGYYFIKKHARDRAISMFAVFAIGVVGLNEWLLPVTPLKHGRTQSALEGVRILRVRDEPLLSARGNPIGVRFSFDATVPRTGAYIISAAAFTTASGGASGGASSEPIWPLQFTFTTRHVQPAPSPQPESPYEIYQKDIVYTISEHKLPNFIRYDEKTQRPCLAEVGNKYVTEADFLSALTANRDVGFRTEIHAEGESGGVRVVAAEGITTRRYNLAAIYDTIAKEGGGRCKP